MSAPPYGYSAQCEAQIPSEVHSRPATLLPYPDDSGFRPVALRPILSGGLPFSNEKNEKELNLMTCNTGANKVAGDV